MVECDFFFKVVLRGVVVRKRKIASQIFFLLGLVIICAVYTLIVETRRGGIDSWIGNERGGSAISQRSGIEHF